MKLGLFITWGPCSIKGVNIGWERGGVVPIEEYDSLYKHFNPVNSAPTSGFRLRRTPA